MRKDALPKRSWRVFFAIVAYKSAHDGCSPALNDLMGKANIRSKSTVKRHIEHLEAAGMLRKPSPNDARGLEVVGGSWVWKPPEAWKQERPLRLPGMKCPVCKRVVGENKYWDADMCLHCALAQEQKNGRRKDEGNQ